MESRINLSTRFRHAQQLDRPQPVHETEYLSVSLWSPQISFCPCLRDAWIRIKYKLNAIYTDPFWQSFLRKWQGPDKRVQLTLCQWDEPPKGCCSSTKINTTRTSRLGVTPSNKVSSSPPGFLANFHQGIYNLSGFSSAISAFSSWIRTATGSHSISMFVTLNFLKLGPSMFFNLT